MTVLMLDDYWGPIMKLTILFLSIVYLSSGNAQTIDSAAVTIVTKVPFNGMNYFITIVPIDSSSVAKMPTYDPTPKRKKTFVWNDSLQFMLPDSVLNLLPKREDFMRPWKPKR